MTKKIIQVKVKPNSKISSIEERGDQPWIAHIKSLPIDGKANEELISLVATHLKCHKSAVKIKSGSASRLKQLIIEI